MGGIAWDGSPGTPGTAAPPPNYPRATIGAVRQQAARMKHGQLVTRVGELALEVGARYGAELQISYNPDSRKIRTKPPFRRGFPDLVIVGPGGAVFAELKCADDTVSPEQRGWLGRLTGAGLTAVIWEPLDTYTGRIETELAALCVRSPYLDRRANA
jgi:hypothetical protein